MSLLPLPTHRGVTSADVTADQSKPAALSDWPYGEASAADLVIAEAHLRHLKDRVRKALLVLQVKAWRRELIFYPAWLLARLSSAPISKYEYRRTLRRAKDAIQLKWDVSAADIVKMLQYWDHASFLRDCSDGQAADCVNELKPLSPAQRASEVRTARANRITLVVWRLQHIIEDHLCTRGCCALGDPGSYERPLDDEGFVIITVHPLILTCSDILPLTQQQARALANKPEVMNAVHISLLSNHLCEYGAIMIKVYRIQKANTDNKKLHKKVNQAQQAR